MHSPCLSTPPCTYGVERFHVNDAVLQFQLSSTKIAMPNTPCKHTRTRLIAKDDDSEFVECLDCGEILEAGELNGNGSFGESLSDA